MVDVTYRHVMIATDGSRAALDAARQAITIAGAFHAKLSVIAVLNTYAFLSEQAGAFTADLIQEEQTFLCQSVEDIARRARQAGIQSVETDVIDGTPGPMLVSAADQRGVDLIVAGSHGRNLIERLLIGSTSEYLVTHAHCPVLVVRPTPEEAGAENRAKEQ